MKYQLTCLTPLLVGDGRALSPIDYMVWKDQVNVLDQERIFRLLARGPRLEGYLTQLRRAEKLDFASWGGFAQNYADRRIPFEHASLSRHWEQAPPDQLRIPTFAAGPKGHYLPASALKGALRTAYLFTRLRPESLAQVAARMEGERPPRHPAAEVEERAVGDYGTDRLRAVEAGDSLPVPGNAFRVYLTRVAALTAKGGVFGVVWKGGGRGGSSAAQFTEMASPGTVFHGTWRERPFFEQQEIQRVLRWREPLRAAALFAAANSYAARALELHRHFAERAGLRRLTEGITQLERRAAELRESQQGCVLSLGWGGGLLSKAASLDTETDPYRAILRQLPYYQRAIQSGLPFPKTRHVVFLEDQPATLPGWVELRVADQ